MSMLDIFGNADKKCPQTAINGEIKKLIETKFPKVVERAEDDELKALWTKASNGTLLPKTA